MKLIIIIIFRFELLAQCQRDLTAEHAAERLRSQSHVHYMQENQK